jgi:mono/diheme cytochrome c family protein
MTRLVVGLGATLLLSAGCDDQRFTQPVTLGGAQVAAATLNRGLKSYNRYCSGCHGRQGDGKAPTSTSMKPRPRDFTRGRFKYHSAAGDLPTDEDLVRTIRGGLQGTHMPAWPDIPEPDLRALVQYIKTFSPRWRKERPGRPLSVTPDPWGAKGRSAAILAGEAVYHGKARCWSCHPAYVDRTSLKRLAAAAADVPGVEARSWQATVHRAAPVKTAYGELAPPDFLSDTVRQARDLESLYRTIAVGVGGTPMPRWQERLSARQLWALAYYVQNLVDKKGTPAAEALRKSLR